MRRNNGKQRLKHEAHHKGSLSYHTDTWYGNILNDYFYSCHKHGHKAVECDTFEKKIKRVPLKRQSVGDASMWGIQQSFATP